MIKKHELHGTIHWVLTQEQIGSVRVAVHVPVNEHHFIEGTRHQLCNLLWLEAILFQLGSVKGCKS